MSGSFSRSWLSTVATTCTSLRKPVREQRPDRPVDQAATQHLLLGRTALALEEAARDLAGGEGLFLVIDGEREEILTRLGGLCADGRAEHDGLAVAGQNGAVGLAGDLARLEDELAAAPVDLLAEVVEHAVSCPSGLRPRAAVGPAILSCVRGARRLGRQGRSRRAMPGARLRKEGAASGRVAGNAAGSSRWGADRRLCRPPRSRRSGVSAHGLNPAPPWCEASRCRSI